jgi:hypothetical protein
MGDRHRFFFTDSWCADGCSVLALDSAQRSTQALANTFSQAGQHSNSKARIYKASTAERGQYS